MTKPWCLTVLGARNWEHGWGQTPFLPLFMVGTPESCPWTVCIYVHCSACPLNCESSALATVQKRPLCLYSYFISMLYMCRAESKIWRYYASKLGCVCSCMFDKGSDKMVTLGRTFSSQGVAPVTFSNSNFFIFTSTYPTPFLSPLIAPPFLSVASNTDFTIS